MSIDDIPVVHPLPWTAIGFMILDADKRQVLHLGGSRDQHGRIIEGKKLEDLTAFLVERANVMKDWNAAILQALRVVHRHRQNIHTHADGKPAPQGCLQLIEAELLSLVPENFNSILKLQEETTKLRTALAQIARGEGRYSLDPLKHAANTVADMKELAEAALKDDA